MSPDQQTIPGTDDSIGSLRQTLSTITLPVDPRQRDRLVRHVDQDLLSFTELTRELMSVPAAALQVCRSAGAIARPRDIDILTLEQACSLLGTQRLRTVLKNLPIQQQDALTLPYRQLIAISEHALLQSQGLFAHRMARLWHELSLSSLLFLAPYWVLIYHRPQYFTDWDNAYLNPDRQTAKPYLASSQWLALAQQLAEDWWLPPWILQGYRSLDVNRRLMVKAMHIAYDSERPHEQQAALDEDRYLSRWLTQPANGPLLANGIALGAHHDWDARHTRRWQQLAALYLGNSLSETLSATHIHATAHAQTRKADNVPGSLWYPAEALIWPQGTRARPRNRNRNNPEPRQSANDGNPTLWRQNCLQLLHQPSSFASLPAILECAMEAITFGLGVKHCWIALYNGRHQQLMIGASNVNLGPGTLLGPCRQLPWGEWLLSRACHNLDQPGRQLCAAMIPADMNAATGNNACHLLPLSHNGQLIGLVYASLGEHDQLLDERRLPALQKTVEYLGKALMNFRERR